MFALFLFFFPRSITQSAGFPFLSIFLTEYKAALTFYMKQDILLKSQPFIFPMQCQDLLEVILLQENSQCDAMVISVLCCWLMKWGRGEPHDAWIEPFGSSG